MFLLANSPHFIQQTLDECNDNNNNNNNAPAVDDNEAPTNDIKNVELRGEIGETEVVITQDIWSTNSTTPRLPAFKAWLYQFWALLQRHIRVQLSQPFVLLSRCVFPVVCFAMILRNAQRWFGDQGVLTDLTQVPHWSPGYYSVLQPQQHHHDGVNAVMYDTTLANDFARGFLPTNINAIAYDMSGKYKWYDTVPWGVATHQQHQQQHQNQLNTPSLPQQHVNTIPGYFMDHLPYLYYLRDSSINTTANTRPYLSINVYNASYTPENNGVQAAGTIYTNPHSVVSSIGALSRLYENLGEHFVLNSAQKGGVNNPIGHNTNNNNNNNGENKKGTKQQIILNKLKISVTERHLTSQRHFELANQATWIAPFLSLWVFLQSIAPSLITERKTKFFHLLRLSNVKLSAYWASHFVCDAMEWVVLAAFLSLPRFFNYIPYIGTNLIPHLDFLAPMWALLFGGVGTILQCYVVSVLFSKHNAVKVVYNVLFVMAFLISLIVIKLPTFAFFYSKYTTATPFQQLLLLTLYPISLMLALWGQKPIISTMRRDSEGPVTWGEVQLLMDFYPLWWAMCLLVYPLFLSLFFYLQDRQWLTIATSPQRKITWLLHYAFCCCYDNRYRDGEVYDLVDDDGGDATTIRDQAVVDMKSRIMSVDWKAQSEQLLKKKKPTSPPRAPRHPAGGGDDTSEHLLGDVAVINSGGHYFQVDDPLDIDIGTENNSTNNSTNTPIVAYGLRKVYPRPPWFTRLLSYLKQTCICTCPYRWEKKRKIIRTIGKPRDVAV